MQTLKNVARIVEKAVMNPQDPGKADRVFDVVRGMFVCPNMSTIATLVGNITACERITLVRAKERFFAIPSAGGWRDIMVCFTVNGDPNKHICEVQVVHGELLMARKGKLLCEPSE